MRKPRRIIAKKYQHIEIESYTIPEIQNKGVLVKTLLSSISHATELAVIQKKTPTFSKKWNESDRLFVKGFSKKYPCKLGYENVGIIIDTGKDVRLFKKGDIVWTDSPHQEYSVISEDHTQMYKIPSKKYLKKSIFLALTTVALNGIHDAKIKPGDRVAVFGLGTVGLITLQLAQLTTLTQCFGIDPIPLRRRKAKSFGACVFDTKDDPVLKIRKMTGGVGVDVVLEASGSTKALHEAIRCCRSGGRVVTLGTYRTGARDLLLGEEWHRNRIELISSMAVNDCTHRDYPRWDLDRLNKTSLNLLVNNVIDVESLITHTFHFNQAKKAYNLLLTHPEKTIKVVFTYE